MPIIRKLESFPERPVIICIYGTPGVGKTSLSNTSENPILVDCDRGADRACNRTDTIIASDWKDVLAEEHEFKNYKTAIFDTAKSILDDYLMTYVVNNDYKLAKNKLKAYGEIGEQFKLFTNKRRAESLDIIVIAHAKEEKDGDITKFSPDVTGQSKDLILRISDQVGFVTMENNKRVICFDPTDKTIGKNVARLPKMEIPDESSPEFRTFMSEIISKVKASIHKQSEEQIQAQQKIEEIKDEISKCVDSESLKSFMESSKSLPEYLKLGAKKQVTARASELSLKWSKESNDFIKA